MSQFENSDIWIEYASSILDERITKKAYTSRDIAKAIGLELLFSMGGAVGAVLGGGAIAGGGGALAGALGISAGAGPAGWILGIALVAGGTAWTIYDLAVSTEHKLSDLISRAEALDYEGTPIEGVVIGWIEKLQEKQEAIKWPSLAGLSVEEKGIKLGTLVAEVKETQKLLSDISEEFEQVKDQLEDWENYMFNDKADFKVALDANIAEVGKLLDRVQKQAFSAGKSAMDALGKPAEIINKINELHKQITSLWAEPQYTDAEKRALEVGKRMLLGQVTTQEVNTYLNVLIKLKADLETKILPLAKQYNSKLAVASAKFAVTLPKEPREDTKRAPGETAPSTPAANPLSQRSYIPRLDIVAKMQQQLNQLSAMYNLPVQQLVVDGRYGPRTSKAAVDTIRFFAKNNPKVLDSLEQGMLNSQLILNWKVMNRDQDSLSALVMLIDDLSQQPKMQGVSGPLSQRDQIVPPTSSPNVDPSRQHPDDLNILEDLKRRIPLIGGSPVNLYHYARTSLGLSDKDMLSLIRPLYGSRAPNVIPTELIIEALGVKNSAFF